MHKNINATEYTKLQLSSSIISIKNYKYTMYINKERAIFWQTWVIKFYSFQANKTFHSRMQDTKTFLTFILCHAYIHHRYLSIYNKICVRFSKMTFKDETTTKNFVNFRNTMQIINCLWWNTIRVDQNDLPRILCLIFKAKRLLKANFDLIFFLLPRKIIEMYHLGFWLSEI